MNEKNENLNELPWTGERIVPKLFNFGAIEHLHRYAIARKWVTGKNIVDIASGEGYGSYLLSSIAKTVKGIDISSEAVNHSRKKYKRDNLEYQVGSASEIPIKDKSVDVVVSFETIEHHDKHEEMMQEIKRILKDDGVLVMSSPDRKNYSEVMQFKIEYHVKELYCEEFYNLVKKYFRNTKMQMQKTVYGSLITPLEATNEFREFSGDFSVINEYTSMQIPWFNICIASDVPIESDGFSYYDGYRLLKEMSDDAQIKNSYDYKIGKRIVDPIRKIKNLFK
jgi:ubiquinone/menaquinone biosynthesis C-methylase UbiE